MVVLLSLVFITCNKNRFSAPQEPLPKYITAAEFIGTPEGFEVYSTTLFIPREEFAGNDEDFRAYVKVANDPRMQKGYFGKRREEAEFAKKPKTLMATKEGTNRVIGSYPRDRGDILVTDEPNASGSGYFAGHAGINSL